MYNLQNNEFESMDFYPAPLDDNQLDQISPDMIDYPSTNYS